MNTIIDQPGATTVHEDAGDVAGFATLPPHLRSELGGVFPSLLTGSAPRLLPASILSGRTILSAESLRRLLDQ